MGRIGCTTAHARALVVSPREASASCLLHWLALHRIDGARCTPGQAALRAMACASNVLVLDVQSTATDVAVTMSALRRGRRLPLLWILGDDQRVPEIESALSKQENFACGAFREKIVARVRRLAARAPVARASACAPQVIAYPCSLPPPPGRGTRSCTMALELPHVRFDEARRLLRVGASRVYLARTPMEVFRALARRAGAGVSRAELIASAWGKEAEIEDAAVDQAIARLRRAIGPQGHDIVKTERGKGYRLALHPDLAREIGGA